VFFSSRRRHTRFSRDWSSDVCSADLFALGMVNDAIFEGTETFKILAEVKKLKADYDGLLLFGVTLKKRNNGLAITRSHLAEITRDRKSTRLNSSHVNISYAVFCLKKK